MPDTHRLAPGAAVDLAAIPTAAAPFHQDGAAAREESRALRRQLTELQNRLYAEGARKLLVVLQAMDAGGKDGSIRRVFRGVNPQGVRVHSFKAPSTEELAHDFLWRVHKVVPAKGMIGVFNRSHYEDVLVVRVEKLVSESVWRPRYDLINDFERALHESGTAIVKFYLHISRAEQKRRFQARLDDPTKRWKFSHDDLEKAKQWDDYMAAYGEALERCNTDAAPWHVIPADDKWYRNLAMARAIVGTLRDMDPRYPPPDTDMAGVKID